MSDEMEQRMCDEDFGSDEEGEEADVESYLEDNSTELIDRLKELEASKQEVTVTVGLQTRERSGAAELSSLFSKLPTKSRLTIHRRRTRPCCWRMRVRGKLMRGAWTR